MAASKLYVVATPLGHRDDITLRAVQVLKATRVIFAEDTREIRKLLEMLGIPFSEKTVHSYASHNLKDGTDSALRFLDQGFDVALVSDRGTPCLSDPGALLVSAARAAGFLVIPVPGPSAVATLWSVSGLTQREFSFVGFFPEVLKDQNKLLGLVAGLNMPFIFFESPRRIRKTLTLLKHTFPEGKVMLAREMTKAFEAYDWLEFSALAMEQVIERGEYSVCVLPNATPQVKPEPLDYWIGLRLASEKEWAKQVAPLLGSSAKEVYNALQERKRNLEL